MPIEIQIEMLAYLLLSAVLSATVGIDRERRDKSAGLRTHMLTGLGACLFTMIGHYSMPEGDPTRMAAGVVSGVGFLGAGVIFRSENRVRDLTTAASIWASAAVGTAVGVGAWLLAIGATVIIWFILAILHRWAETLLHPLKANGSSPTD